MIGLIFEMLQMICYGLGSNMWYFFILIVQMLNAKTMLICFSGSSGELV